MTIYYQDDLVTLYHGDCLEVLASLPDNSVHAVCTDPPYGLANTSPEQVADTIVRWVNGDRDYLPGGSGFMGKAWDAFVPPVAVWDECLRVLKPGGHVLAFAGSRTVDLMTLGIRLAGFEIRDSIAWLYGSGFPKSLDVSKAIDKMNGRDMPMRYALARHIREVRESAGFTRADVAAWFPQYREVTANWERCDEHGNRVPTPSDWDVLRERLSVSDEWLPLINRVEAERAVVGTRAGNRLAVAPGQGEDRSAVDLDVTTHATPDAERWQGWGTALKPAFEPIVVARKPLTGTVAANVLEHGTGALNIDATRVSMSDEDRARIDAMGGFGRKGWTRADGTLGEVYEGTVDGSLAATDAKAHPAGRWPTNVLLDDTQAAELDKQSGTLTSGKMQPTHTTASREVYGQNAAGGYTTMETYGDSGGASRFFPTFRYEAKAPTEERPRVNGVAHPTVKPLDLMRWLVRLVTPPGGTVLDPFAGSGTTLEAALIEGFQCIGIEREADYLPLIKARITKPLEPVLDLGGIT